MDLHSLAPQWCEALVYPQVSREEDKGNLEHPVLTNTC